MINVQLACDKSTIEHRSSNISHPGENVAHAQPSVSHEDNMSRSSVQVKILKRMTENQQHKDLKRSQKMWLRVGLKKSRKRSQGKTRKTMKLYSEVYIYRRRW